MNRGALIRGIRGYHHTIFIPRKSGGVLKIINSIWQISTSISCTFAASIVFGQTSDDCAVALGGCWTTDEIALHAYQKNLAGLPAKKVYGEVCDGQIEDISVFMQRILKPQFDQLVQRFDARTSDGVVANVVEKRLNDLLDKRFQQHRDAIRKDVIEELKK